MKFRPTELPEVVHIEPDVFRDARGFFLETWHERKYREGGVPGPFVQDNFSRSQGGALRGLHAQLDPAQGKLIHVVRGEIYDVAVDLRVGSPRFARHVGVRLTGESQHQLWIPPGFAHGFCVLSDEADVEYKCTAPYNPQGEIAVAWDDPRIGVPWPTREPVLSARDAAAPPLAELEARLPRYEG